MDKELLEKAMQVRIDEFKKSETLKRRVSFDVDISDFQNELRDNSIFTTPDIYTIATWSAEVTQVKWMSEFDIDWDLIKVGCSIMVLHEPKDNFKYSTGIYQHDSGNSIHQLGYLSKELSNGWLQNYGDGFKFFGKIKSVKKPTQYKGGEVSIIVEKPWFIHKKPDKRTLLKIIQKYNLT